MQALTRPRAPESLPVRLDRRRVYVLPTATGLFFALLLGTMGLGALNYNNNPALLLALLLAGAAQASLLFAHLQLSGVRIEAVADLTNIGILLAFVVTITAYKGFWKQVTPELKAKTSANVAMTQGDDGTWR